MCQHVVESAEGFGEDGGIRFGGGDRRGRGARSIRVGLDMLGGAFAGAAGKLKSKVEAGNCLDGLLRKRVGEPANWEQHDGDGYDCDVGRGRGGEMEQRGGLLVVGKNVVALKVKIQVVCHCCAR